MPISKHRADSEVVPWPPYPLQVVQFWGSIMVKGDLPHVTGPPSVRINQVRLKADITAAKL